MMKNQLDSLVDAARDHEERKQRAQEEQLRRTRERNFQQAQENLESTAKRIMGELYALLGCTYYPLYTGQYAEARGRFDAYGEGFSFVEKIAVGKPSYLYIWVTDNFNLGMADCRDTNDVLLLLAKFKERQERKEAY